jgi:hypothetical protein
MPSQRTEPIGEREITLFDGQIGDDHAQVWLELHGDGLTLRTQEWGSGIERNFGFDTIETWLAVGESASTELAAAVRDEVHEANEASSPAEVIAMWLAGDSTACAHLRLRLERLGLRYEFTMR